MVTAVTGLGNSAGAATMPQMPQEPVLSEMAQATLERLGRMHSEFSESAGAVLNRAAPVQAAESGDLARSMQSVSEAFQTATRVQSQIVQFSMATSISQSLGNNLNSFLKGT